MKIFIYSLYWLFVPHYLLLLHNYVHIGDIPTCCHDIHHCLSLQLVQLALSKQMSDVWLLFSSLI